MSSRITQPTTDQLRRWSADPMGFFGETIIPTAAGDVPLSRVWVDFQVEAFRVVADCLLAVAAGNKPPYRGIWVERTKGGSKDSDVALALLWLLLFTRRPQTVELAADDLDQILETRNAMKEICRANPWMEERITVLVAGVRCEATNRAAIFWRGARAGHTAAGRR